MFCPVTMGYATYTACAVCNVQLCNLCCYAMCNCAACVAMQCKCPASPMAMCKKHAILWLLSINHAVK